MKYAGMPAGNWMLFRRSFQKQLTESLNLPSGDTETLPDAA